MKKLLFIALSTIGLFSLPAPEASAAPVAPVTQSGPTVLPAQALEAPVVVVGARRRRYRYVRRPYYYHGHRRYRSVRVVL